MLKSNKSQRKKEPKKMSIWSDLLARRVPHIVGIYLGISWGIIQFVDWIVKSTQMSPHFALLSFVILAAMIPTVLLLAYYHGKPGYDTWTIKEKIGIPTNLILS